MRVTRGIADVSPARTAATAVGTRSPVAPAGSGSAVTVGNFDGVHIGHQAMLDRVRESARARGLQNCVLTFEPHPRELFTPGQAPTRLTSLREKLELLAEYGVERTHVSRFSRAFASMPAADFVERVLVGTLGARWVLVGGDFRFGARRGGDVQLLRDMGQRHGFEVEVMPEVLHGNTRVASSAVREALRAGDLDAAKQLLGRAYTISGRVVHGDKLGRQLGYATANIRLEHNRAPFTGIFAVRLRGEGAGFESGARNGVASLGVRPTVKASGAQPVLEVYLFDFKEEIYGESVRVDFLHKFRDEVKYVDLETLKQQIARDVADTRAYFSRHAV